MHFLLYVFIEGTYDKKWALATKEAIPFMIIKALILSSNKPELESVETLQICIYSRYYNKLSNKLGLNSESSTVINGPKSHAYNVILYEQSGKLETKYYDLTKSSSQSGLTFRVKDINPVTKENQKKQSTINNSNSTEKEKKPAPKYNGEIWVNNTQKSDSVDQQT